jgi:two-component system sensor histidine kinase KdpD
MPFPYKQVTQGAIRLAGILGLVSALTAINFKVLHVNNATAALSYLLVILGVATKAGLRESIVACLGSMLCYNYFFLPPIGTLTIADPQNWVALCVFLITAVTASKLSTSARQRADEAGAGRQEMERLYEFSRALMLGDNERRLPSQIAQQVAGIFAARSVDFYEAASETAFHAGSEEPSNEMPDLLRAVTFSGEARASDDNAVYPVQLGGRTLGSLAVSGAHLSETVLAAICQLAAISLERARAQQVINRGEATRQNEQLKSTLLDALAHEFKTPLTSIKAAISAVLSQRSHDSVEGELLTIVDEEADHLTDLVTEAIQVARIGTGQVKLHLRPYPASKLILSALSDLRALRDGREIGVTVSEGLPELSADPDLTGLALRQLIGNALKYAPASAKIAVSAERTGDFVTVHVANEGPGIPPSEQEAIFEKFYRGQDVRDRVPGTGMGLTISRDIIQAHGGQLWVESEPGKGVRFSFTLRAGRAGPQRQELLQAAI